MNKYYNKYKYKIKLNKKVQIRMQLNIDYKIWVEKGKKSKELIQYLQNQISKEIIKMTKIEVI